MTKPNNLKKLYFSKMTSINLDKHYDPKSIEQYHYQDWMEKGFFKNQSYVDNENSQTPYSIVIPPPNVTGTLHMGHAFQDTIMDILIRYHRMKGFDTLWQPGMDHAGIATQMVVERQLNAKGENRHDLGREAFIEKVWQWKEESGGTINSQLQRMGASADWERERFTMDEGLSEAVQDVFIRLYNEGLIYRGKRLVNWDPAFQTAVSDLEVISEEEDGHMYHVAYKFVDGDDYMHIATTRPETILADGALAVHPDDERFTKHLGRMVHVPLTNRTIPVIADEYVDPEFGSGCVKITPAHDFNDFEVGERHEMEVINLLTPDAKMNDNAPEAYRGLDRFDARKAIVDDLEKQGLLQKIEPHKLMRPRGDRSGSVIEPYLTDQWYVKVEPLAKKATEVVESGEIRFVPDNWKNTYYEWMRNIKDWCISRQLWWGHRIPAWYDEEGNIYVAENLEQAQMQALEKRGKAVALNQDEDVLDTWFSSALWPFSTMGWPEQTKELDTYYPTSVLVTGFDIIFFWVARMVMFGTKFTGKIPFHEVYIHGLVRDQDGQKMSKSKGNVLDPIDLIDGITLEDLVAKRTSGMMQPHLAEKIEKSTRQHFPDGIASFGTDALRFTFASLATLGRDVRFDLSRIEGNRNFCNKLWNAARFVFMNVEDKDCGQQSEFILGTEEKWLIASCQQVIKQTDDNIKTYRFDLYSQNLYSFIWDEYCSWYLEMAKVILNNPEESEARKIGTRHTLVNMLDTILRLAHPIMPYITEEIWHKTRPYINDKENKSSIMISAYPEFNADLVDQDALNNVAAVQSIISSLRNLRSEMNIEPSKRLNVFIDGMHNTDTAIINQHQKMIMSLAKLDSIQAIDDTLNVNECASTVCQHMTLLVPLGDVIDAAAETERLTREQEKVQKDIDKLAGQLNNANFMDRAPAAVVEKNKQDYAKLIETQKQISLQLEKFKAMQ